MKINWLNVIVYTVLITLGVAFWVAVIKRIIEVL